MGMALPLLWTLAASVVLGPSWAAERNVLEFGALVRPQTMVEGDFTAIGRRVVVDQAVADDALLLGGTIDVRAPVGEDVRAAGGDILLESLVGCDLMAAGGHLALLRSAQVAGRAEMAGGTVLVDGRVDGALNVRARRLVLNGTVGGSVQADIETLDLGPQARVGGALRHTATAITEDAAAVVSGPLERVDRLFGDDARWGRGGRHPMHAGGWPTWNAWWLMVPLSMGLLGIVTLASVLLLAFSGFAGQVALQIERAPWRALGVGALCLLALPALSVLLFFTLLGIPLGLVVLALYPPLLLLGWTMGALFAARRLPSSAGAEEPHGAAVGYGRMLVAVIALLVVGAVPVVGPWLTAATTAAGLGGCVLEWRRRLATRAGSAA